MKSELYYLSWDRVLSLLKKLACLTDLLSDDNINVLVTIDCYKSFPIHNLRNTISEERFGIVDIMYLPSIDSRHDRHKHVFSLKAGDGQCWIPTTFLLH